RADVRARPDGRPRRSGRRTARDRSAGSAWPAHPELDWRSVGAAALLAFSLIGVLASFIWHFDRPLLYRDRRMILLAGLILVATIAARMVIPGRPLWAFIFPLPAVSMLLAILIDAQLALAVGVM